MNRSWTYIAIGTLFEVGWVVGFKHAEDPLSWAATIAALVVSFYLVIRASFQLPVGTVYAVFTGLGTAGTVVAEMTLTGIGSAGGAVVGMLFFRESRDRCRLFCIGLVLIAAVGLKLIA